jgi:hypothetical protein
MRAQNCIGGPNLSPSTGSDDLTGFFELPPQNRSPYLFGRHTASVSEKDHLSKIVSPLLCIAIRSCHFLPSEFKNFP